MLVFSSVSMMAAFDKQWLSPRGTTIHCSLAISCPTYHCASLGDGNRKERDLLVCCSPATLFSDAQLPVSRPSISARNTDSTSRGPKHHHRQTHSTLSTAKEQSPSLNCPQAHTEPASPVKRHGVPDGEHRPRHTRPLRQGRRALLRRQGAGQGLCTATLRLQNPPAAAGRASRRTRTGVGARGRNHCTGRCERGPIAGWRGTGAEGGGRSSDTDLVHGAWML